MEMWHLRKLEFSFEDVRESGVAGHSMMCDVSLPINRDHRVLSVKGLVFFLLRGSRIKHEITTLGLLSVMCQPGVAWGVLAPCPCAARGGRRILSCSNSAFACGRWRCSWHCLPKSAAHEGSEELGEIPECLLSCLNAGEVPCCSQPKMSPSCHPASQCCCFYPKCAQ